MNNNSTPKPTEGLLVISSYDATNQYGYYQIFNISNKERILDRHFYETKLSENLISFLGMNAALEYCKNVSKICDVYSANQFAVKWSKNRVCNTKCSDTLALKSVEKAIAFLNSNDFASKIKLWLPTWGKAKDFIYNYPQSIS